MTLATRIVQHPSWARAHFENYANQVYDRFNSKPWFPPAESSLHAALAEIGGWSKADIEAVLQVVPSPRRPESTNLFGSPDGSSELVSIVYACCRLMRPQLVVESGVAHGFTTAAILRALNDNQQGRLVSIDLPHLHPRAVESIGTAVEPGLRDRWELHLGPATSELSRVITHTESIDIFVQDASHTERGQLAEYRAAWPRIREAGLLISDDAGKAAEAFGRESSREPVFVNQPRKSRPVAIFRR
jgi:predicted O-methyltransferase YrrM